MRLASSFYNSNTNCVSIHQKSGGRLFATGDDDKIVNIWALSSPKPLISLDGHDSAISSILYHSRENYDQEFVIAGSVAGNIKIWDVEQGKSTRTLLGHKSECSCIAFHPTYPIFVTGGADAELKFWDIRAKAAVHSLKGHSDGINVLRFSPDGKWSISGAEDGVVKLWDLVSGKLFNDFTSHLSPITSVALHPTDCMLATASDDVVVTFWDLETFDQITSFKNKTSSKITTCFTTDGEYFVCAARDNFQIINWEPYKVYNNITYSGLQTPKELLVDFSDTLIAATIGKKGVNIWASPISESSNKSSLETKVFPPQSSINLEKESTATISKDTETKKVQITKPEIDKPILHVIEKEEKLPEPLIQKNCYSYPR